MRVEKVGIGTVDGIPFIVYNFKESEAKEIFKLHEKYKEGRIICGFSGKLFMIGIYFKIGNEKYFRIFLPISTPNRDFDTFINSIDRKGELVVVLRRNKYVIRLSIKYPWLLDTWNCYKKLYNILESPTHEDITTLVMSMDKEIYEGLIGG